MPFLLPNVEKLKASGNVPGLISALHTKMDNLSKNNAKRAHVRYDAAVALGELRAAPATPDLISAALRDENPWCERDKAIARAAIRALDQIGPEAADKLYADAEAFLFISGRDTSSLLSGQVRLAALAMAEVRNLSADMERHRRVSGPVILRVKQHLEGLRRQFFTIDIGRDSALRLTHDALSEALEQIAPTPPNASPGPAKWSAELAGDPATEHPAATARVAHCTICGVDLSAAPAVRNNDTGALYCYEHREHVLE
jgi:hypothetical protein